MTKVGNSGSWETNDLILGSEVTKVGMLGDESGKSGKLGEGSWEMKNEKWREVGKLGDESR